MRTSHLFAFCIFGFAVLFLFPAITVGQFGGGKKKGGGGFGGGTSDPNQLFDIFAKGQPTIVIGNQRTFRDSMTAYAAEKGISNGQLTRPQFADFWEQQSKSKAAGGSPGGSFGGGKGNKSPGGADEGGGGMKKKFEFGGTPGAGFPGFPGAPNPATPVSPDILNQLADAQFKKLDRDGDGRLNQEEMPPPLRFGLSKWDRDNDGLISQNEFRDFFSARMVGNGDDPATRNIATIIIEVEELDRKPVVFRAGGAMPAGVPPWFKELDTDKDGQVGLYEWRKGATTLEKYKVDPDLEEYHRWDLNNDGFITPDEAIRYLALSAAPRTAVASASGSSSGDRPASGKGGFGGFGGFGGKGGGKGKKSDRP